MNINRYVLCKERSLQKIISKQPKPNTTAIGVCSETQVTHHIITKRSDECLPISAYVPKHKEGDGKKFPVIIDIYGGDFVAGRSALNRNFGAWCAEHGYLTFIPEYTPVPETNLFGQLGDLLKAFVVIHRCAERYGADMSRMYLVGDGAGAALACLVYALLWNPVSMQHLEDELPFDVPQEAKLSFKGVCLQNGILDLSSRKMNAIAPYQIKQYTDGGKKQDEIEFESVTFADGMCMDVRCVPRKDGPSWCEAAIYYANEDVVTSEPYNSFYNHWVCQTANATYHLYMCVADTE